MSVEVIRAAMLEGVPHGFLGRRGGVSTGVHAGLNVGLGSKDERASVEANRRLALDAVAPGARLVTLHQVHSPHAVVVNAPFPDNDRPHAAAPTKSTSASSASLPAATRITNASSRRGAPATTSSTWRASWSPA
jgi:copper oxidase (laccase) domain-containing protein